MTAIIIKAILIVIAAICKAAADTIVHHPLTSRLKGRFWKPWPHNNYIPLTKFPWDGWHLCNSAMIVLLMVQGYFTAYPWYYEIPAAGILWVLVFNLFYNKILVK